MSKNALLSFMSFEPVECEVFRQPTAILPQSRKKFTGCSCLLDLDIAGPGNTDFYVITFL